jgi:hypothetical protein
LAIPSRPLKSASDILAARQFINDPALWAAQSRMRMAATSDSSSEAIVQTISFLRTVVNELAIAFDLAKSKRIQFPATSGNQISQIQAETQQRNDFNAKFQQVVQAMMATLGHESKQHCNPTQQLIEARTAELARMVGKVESAAASSVYPLPADLVFLVKRLRPMLQAVPTLFRHSVPQ